MKMSAVLVLLSSVLIFTPVVRAEKGVPSAGASEQSAPAHSPADDEQIQEGVIPDDPDKEFLKLPEKEYTSQEKQDLDRRQSIKKAEKLYSKAVKSYEKGNVRKARDYYLKAMEELWDNEFDIASYYAIKTEVDGIFEKLGKEYYSTARSTCPADGRRYCVPLDEENELVQKYLKLYTQGKSKKVIRKALERSGRYRNMIMPILKEYDIPEEMVYLPIVESLYNVDDRSWAGAVGLWQIMSHRGRALGLKINYWIDERKDPEKSTRAAAKYLQELHIMFDDWHLALAAYNRGENGLGRDLKFSQAVDIEQMSNRKAGPRETRMYVPQFITAVLIGEDPEKYGFDVEYDPPFEYDTVTVNEVIDLKIVAKCAGTTLEKIRELNPAITAWCTPQGYDDFELHLPVGAREQFLENIVNVKDKNPSRGFIKYKVVKGDSLSRIAHKFGTTVRAVKEDNKIKNPRLLRIGKVLIIRPGQKYFNKR
ncbi:MAG: transglycosylase SLT domain-containing protein [Endomicrobiales bacterium]|nr:transglycosylase SLT domain-containing protein [Endomicrobiales bacterium]